ncbi:DUF1801 domain-containing protein [bacterium]|nr:DUF1801 domain-containing protein [bacterium]
MENTEVNQYLQTFGSEEQKVLQQMRQIIKEALPQADEIMSYGMPAYKQNKVLVYFGGNKNHLGFYPTASGIENFKHEFGNYKWSKGAVQFPYNQPLPVDLITRICIFRLQVVLEKK